jgi:hypothetical protein
VRIPNSAGWKVTSPTDTHRRSCIIYKIYIIIYLYTKVSRMDKTGGFAWLSVLIVPVRLHVACGAAESAATEAEILDVEPEKGLTQGGLLCLI